MKDIFDVVGRLKEKELGCGVFALSFVIALAIIVGWFMFTGWVFQVVWNNALVPTFDLPYLQYWASVGIVWLLQFVGGCFKKVGSNGKNN